MIKIFDDATGEEIPKDSGVQVTALLEGESTPRQLVFAKWSNIPEQLTNGLVITEKDGTTVDTKIVKITIVDVALVKALQAAAPRPRKPAGK